MVLFLFLITLMINSSCQENSTEKSLNEMLDELIDETVLNYSRETENNSRIIYIKPDNLTRRNHNPNNNGFSSQEFKEIESILHQMEDQNDLNHQSKEVSLKIERTVGNYLINGEEHDLEIINNEIMKSGRPDEEGINSIAVLGSDPGNNLIHNYPEIVIDKITYDTDENGNIMRDPQPTLYQSKIQPAYVPTIKVLSDEDKNEVAAKALDSLLKMILHGVASRKSLQISTEKDHEDLSNIERSARVHNAYRNHVINNLPLPYDGIVRGKMSLGKLPEGYPVGQLHGIIASPMSAYLNSDLQLTRWGGNAGQNPLMSISRAHNRNRVRFVPKPLNIVPRILYQPVFHRNYRG